MRRFTRSTSSGVDRNVVQRVEAFLAARRFKPIASTQQSFLGHDTPRTPLRIAPLAIFERRLEVVADHPEPVLFGRCDVALTAFPGRIRVVDHEWLFGVQARVEQQLLAVPGAEHVEVYPHVRLKETLLEEGGFPRPLNPNEDDGFHVLPPTAAGP